MAPYWADVDTSGIGTVWYRQTTNKLILNRAQRDVTKDPTLFPALDLSEFSPTLVFVATWDHVGYYDGHTDKVINAFSFSGLFNTGIHLENLTWYNWANNYFYTVSDTVAMSVLPQKPPSLDWFSVLYYWETCIIKMVHYLCML